MFSLSSYLPDKFVCSSHGETSQDERLIDIFGHKYGKLIFSFFSPVSEGVTINDQTKKIKWYLDGPESALRRLCKEQGQIATNILYKVIQMRDINVVVSTTCSSFYQYGDLSVESLRTIARNELSKRPAYDINAYSALI